jgi:hypothetical protein
MACAASMPLNDEFRYAALTPSLAQRRHLIVHQGDQR